MKSSLAHIQVNIDFANISFYKELMDFLGWKVLYSDETVAGFAGDSEASIWYLKATESGQQNYDAAGVNHIGISVSEMKDIDKIAEFLKEKNILALFETPRHRPEFAHSETETYYQVMFESPDKVLFEIVYTGPKK